MNELPKRRIGEGTKWMLLALFVCIDLLQIALNLFGIGIIANKLIDILVAFFLIIYLNIKGVAIFSDPRILLSIGATFTAEFMPIPFVDAAPFWTLDIWYITRTVQKEDSQRIADAETAIAAEEERLEQQKIMQMRLREQYRQGGYDEELDEAA